ncbi:hypothetical protein [Massilia pseudoviolaceinigra]|uniref:hypothetical protein n=1 Tax=Massilia pseudoviolaceinigra TaxID=3057165 RepID=UPI0027968B46|nr:hypothetical protein [Massilia sp. CCM 9206]MDQ1920418.1 hypothetical protein [Massilia sp. CCM 9206]
MLFLQQAARDVATSKKRNELLTRHQVQYPDEVFWPVFGLYILQTSPVYPLCNAIEHLRAMPANWSATPVAAPDAAQIEAAQRGLIMLMLAGVPAPALMLLNDGTVAAFWRRADAYASIDFDADGEFAWSAASTLEITSGTWTGGAMPSSLRDIIGV